MPIQFRYLSGSIAAALFAASTLAAQADVLVGTPVTPGIGNCIPFGCFRNYQQVYSSSLFSGPISITGLTFFNTQVLNSATIDPAIYTITLSSGGATVGSLSTTFANNVGANAETFFSGFLSGPAAPSFTISGNAFDYDPSSGDLLVQIFKNTGSAITGSDLFNDSNNNFLGFQRVFNSDGSLTGTVDTNVGLITQFDTSPVSTVPLPAALPLFATGLGALGLLGWRRKKAAAG